MIHPHTRISFINPDVGYGVVATQPIPMGTITWVKDPLDREIPPDVFDGLVPSLREAMITYCYRNRLGHYVLCWDHTKYMNHSFTPTCHLTAYNLQIAVRDIKPDEQLTDDYGYLNIIESFAPVQEEGGRDAVHPDDLLRHHEDWDRNLLAAFRHLPRVDQPMREQVDDSTWQTCLDVAEEREDMISIRSFYYTPGTDQSRS
ncbi:MAG: SET domain-containing protein [Verrucomicrobia bacterium]|nr:SET domain-containing protein [Verrucomicrobiota bacterium]